MAGTRLKRLLRRTNGDLIRRIFDSDSAPLLLVDEDGGEILANQACRLAGAGDDMMAFPLEAEGVLIGQVIGLDSARVVQDLLAIFLENEANSKALGAETLHLYREINLLYNLAENLSDSETVEAVAETALHEVNRLIDCVCGSILLQEEDGGRLSVVAMFGSGLPEKLDPASDHSLILEIFSSAKAEILMDALSDPRANPAVDRFPSLICVPLAGNSSPLGVIVLADEADRLYTAADLKLVQAVASQTAPAIESARRYEKAIAEARAREELLQRQIQKLQIELDDKRQTEKVAEITETDYFKTLRGQAANLRGIFED